MVLLAVFLPAAFIGGITGQLYRQFALTIATATVFSAINALTLSPALSALLLRPTSARRNIFARGFNLVFDRFQAAYGVVVSGLIRRAFMVLILFAGLSAATFWGFTHLPRGFVPEEDKGWALISIQLPDAATLDRTKAVVDVINERLGEMPGIKSYVSIPGLSVMDMSISSNTAVVWTVFDPWDKRRQAGLTRDRMLGQLWGAVPNIQEAMIFGFPPLSTVVDLSESLGPQVISRYNLYPSARLNGQGSPGVSSVQAIEIMENLADQHLPEGIGFEWTGLSREEKAAQGQTLLIMLASVLFVYLVLCAQYESWTLPLSVILAVPLAVAGTVVAVAVREMDINVYTQIGLVLLIALTCKTAILIAEFARTNRDAGHSIFDSALNAARLRFRPILMTAATFILGVFPLVIATGAGAGSRQALGTAVFSGMLSATILLIFFVPVFYSLIQRGSESLRAKFGTRQSTGEIEKILIPPKSIPESK